MRGYLDQASQHLSVTKMTVHVFKHVWKCTGCEAQVFDDGDGGGGASNCAANCLYQCPPGVYVMGHARRQYFYKRSSKAGSKVWRSTETLGDQKYVKHLRITGEMIGSMVPGSV